MDTQLFVPGQFSEKAGVKLKTRHGDGEPADKQPGFARQHTRPGF
jgi:hypothetical protein